MKMSQVSIRLPDGIDIRSGLRIVLPASITLNIPGIGEIRNVVIVTGTGRYYRENGILSMEGGTINYSGGSLSGPINVENLKLQLTSTGLTVSGRGCKTVFLFPVCQNVDVTIPYSGTFNKEIAQNLIESVVLRTGKGMVTFNQMMNLFMRYRSA